MSFKPGIEMNDKYPVTREALPDGPEILTLYCEDAPDRPGNEPQNGDTVDKLQFPLHDGRRLELHCGKETMNHFVAILAAATVDDLE